MVIGIGFVLYANILIYIGQKSKLVKIPLGILAYFLFSCLLISPALMVSNCIDNWREEFDSNNLYFFFFFILFVLTPVPGWVLFKKQYLSKLKTLGYFTNM